MKNTTEKTELPDLLEYVTIQVMRASGPGGQNVNKVNSKVRVILFIPDLEPNLRTKLLESAFIKKLNERQELVVTCQESRSQSENKRTAISRIYDLIDEALEPQTERQVFTQEDLKTLYKTQVEAKARTKRQTKIQKQQRSNKRWDEYF